MTSGDSVSVASLLALALGLVKIIETLVAWGVKKMSKKEETKTYVQLAPDASRMIRETHERVGEMHVITNRYDQDGTPLVYGPRRDIHALAASAEKIEEKLEEIDAKAEAFVNIVSKKQG